MTEALPPDWAIEEALRRSDGSFGYELEMVKQNAATSGSYASSILAHARTIVQHEKPISRELRCAREIVARAYETDYYKAKAHDGAYDDRRDIALMLAFAELYKSEFGK